MARMGGFVASLGKTFMRSPHSQPIAGYGGMYQPSQLPERLRQESSQSKTAQAKSETLSQK
jgi:hypothetical protein